LKKDDIIEDKNKENKEISEARTNKWKKHGLINRELGAGDVLHQK